MIQSGEEKFDYLFKIVIVGDSNVGKSNIISRLVKNEFNMNEKATIGVDFSTKIYKFENALVKVLLWDTAGQERYHALVSAYYRGSAGAVIVYDLTDERSFENISTIWLKNIRNVTNDDIPLMILGNKSDLKDQIAVPKQKGEDLAMAQKSAFFETSALSGDNITTAFELFVKQIYDRERTKESTKSKRSISESGLKIKNVMEKKKSSGWCC